MRKRGSRPLKELYNLTRQIDVPEITPVLEGSCRIQGPVDEPDNQLPKTNSSMFTTENKCAFKNENLLPRIESGTCNTCSAPCSSCMHSSRTASFMESNIDCPLPCNTLGRKGDDHCSSIEVEGLPLYKSQTCHNNHHAASETSNLLSTTSSHDPYSENADSKATGRNGVYEASDAVDMPPRVSSFAECGNNFMTKTNVTAGSLPGSQSNMIIGCKTSSSQNKERLGPENQGDTISCISAVRDVNTGDVHIADTDCNMEVDKKDVPCASEPRSSLLGNGLKDKVEVGATSSSGPSAAPDPADLPHEDIYLNVQSLAFSSENDFSFHRNSESKDFKGNPSGQVQAEPFESSMETLESMEPLSKGEFVADSADEQKLTTVPSFGDNKVSEVPAKLNVVDDGFDPISGLYDVKVCDTCGDAGREELLAICSRCIDGAQHTYCMRKKLDILPKGDWLCEECKTKEDAEILKAGESESAYGRSHNLRSTFNSKRLPSINTKTNDQESRLGIKALQSSQVSSMRDGDNLVDSSVTTKKASEASGKSMGTANISSTTKAVDQEARLGVKALQSSQVSSARDGDSLVVSSVTTKMASETSGRSMGTASPRQKTPLSREVSLDNLDMGKVKGVNKGSQIGGQFANNAPFLPRLQKSSSSNSFKIQARVQSPRVPISRSNSLNNSNLKPSPTVKQMNENASNKVKSNGESTSFDLGIKGSINTMTKSTSFKSVSLNLPNTEMVGRIKSPIPSPSEAPNGAKQDKEQNIIEKKNCSSHDHTAPLARKGILLPKVDPKVVQHVGRLESTSEFKNQSNGKVSDNGNVAVPGRKEEKQQSLSKSFRRQSSDETCNTADSKSGQVSEDDVRVSFPATHRTLNRVDSILQKKPTQAAVSLLCDDKAKDGRDVKTKESSHVSSSKQPISGVNQILRCQRCNETGHATHFCPINKLSATALKPSAERVLKEGVKKNNKWKDAVEAINMKTGMQSSNRLRDRLEELQLPGSGFGVTSRDTLSKSSSSPSDLPYVERRNCDQATARDFATKPGKVADNNTSQKDIHPVEDLYALMVDDTSITFSNSEESSFKPKVIFPNQDSALPNSLRASAIPELDFIWQGGFEVIKNGKLPELFNGIQAHLSTCASPKIPEVVTKFPCKVQLEEVPRMSSWPLQFQGTGPKKEDVALFLFAKDIKSYETYYSKLLENMLTNDLALRGNINGVEILIFASNTLPTNSQCWNMLFYLWAVFRGRTTDCLEDIPASQKNPCQSILCKHLLVPDCPFPHINDLSYSQKLDSVDNQAVGLSWCDISLKSKEVNQGLNQRPSLLNSYSETRLQSNAKVWPGDEDTSAVYMKNSGTVSKEENAEPPSLFHAGYLQASPGAPTVNSDSLNYSQGTGADGCQRTKGKNKLRSESDHPSCVPSPRGKHGRSPSLETVSHTCGETSRITDDAKVWRESTDWNAEDESLYKKMKLFDQGTSTMGHPTLDSSLKEVQPSDGIPEEPTSLTNSNNVIHTTPDNEDLLVRHAPLLQPASGSEKKLFKQKELPLLLPLATANACSDRPPGHHVEEDYGQTELPLLLSLGRNGDQEMMMPGPAEEDDPALTLTLGFSSTTTKPVLRAEIPEEPHINTSLRLF